MSQSTFPRVETVNGQQCLIVAMPLQEPTMSSTGKSYIIAKTGWNKTAFEYQGKQVTVTGTALVPLK